MKRIALLPMLAGLLLLVGCQLVISKIFIPKKDVRKAEHKVLVDRAATMTSSDGVEFVSYVYRPKTLEKVPTVLVRVPFTKNFVNTTRANVVGRFWAQRGYAAVIQGTRGRFLSGGGYYPLRGERADGIETLEWLAEQPWYDGRIGMWGGSTFGYTQWVLADQQDPGLSALDIQIASTSFYGMFYPGGAFSLESALFWAVRSRGERDEDPSYEDLEGGFDGFPLIEADDRAGKDIPFFNDWVSHVERDDYWIEIDGRDRPRKLKAPALLMAGWYDPFLPTQIEDFAQIRLYADRAVASATQLVIGPWAHARTFTFPDGYKPRSYRQDSLAPSVAWFDKHLKKDDSVPETAPVRIFVMGDNVWRNEQEWPLARAQYVPYYLRSDGKANGAGGDGVLTTEPPTAQELPDHYVYDPTDPVPTAGGAMIGPRSGVVSQNLIEIRPDVLVYSTAPLAEDLEVTGPIELVLHVSTSAPNTDFTAKLVDVFPDGGAFNVCGGVLRRRYDGATTEISIELWPTSMVFRAGHRVRLEVSSSNYPRYDRNPNTGRTIPSETEPVPARQTVHHGAGTPSRLVLPLVPRQSGTKS